MFDALTDVPGITVGHAQDLAAKTGVTVVLCPEGSVGGVDARGFAYGARDLGPLCPTHLVGSIDALMLAGGSAFGLAASDGVMQYLEEQGRGFDLAGVKVPIVAGAVIFDLSFGSSKVRPDKEMGFKACLNATAGKIAQGSVGAGTGATVGKICGIPQAMKGGLGTVSLTLDKGLVVAALAVVNAFGDVVDPETGQILAGARNKEGTGWAYTEELIKESDIVYSAFGQSTTLGVVATNGRLSRAQASIVATAGHDGLARAIRPAHTIYDGDIVFALATGQVTCQVSQVATAGAEALARAIKRAVVEADGLGLVSAHVDLEH